VEKYVYILEYRIEKIFGDIVSRRKNKEVSIKPFVNFVLRKGEERNV